MKNKRQNSMFAGISTSIASVTLTVVLVFVLSAQAQYVPQTQTISFTTAGETKTWDYNNTLFSTVKWTNNLDYARVSTPNNSPHFLQVSNASGQVGAGRLDFSAVHQNSVFSLYGDPLRLGEGGMISKTAGMSTPTISNDLVLTASQVWTSARNETVFDRLMFIPGNISSIAGEQTDVTFDTWYINTYYLQCGYRLGGTNSFTGSAILKNGAKLTPDYSVTKANKVNPAYPFVFAEGGGILEWAGGDNTFTQRVQKTLLDGNTGATVRRLNGSTLFDVGMLERNSDFSTFVADSVTGALILTNQNVNGLVGPWATLSVGWLFSYGLANTAGFQPGTSMLNLSAWTSPTANALLDNTPSGTMASGAQLYTLRTTTGRTVNIADTLELKGGGLLVTTAASFILNGGSLYSGLDSGALFVHTYNYDATIGSVLADNPGTGKRMTLVKSGYGNRTLTLNGANTYTGDTYIHNGKITIGTGGRLGGSNLYAQVTQQGVGATILEFAGSDVNETTLNNIKAETGRIFMSGTGTLKLNLNGNVSLGGFTHNRDGATSILNSSSGKTNSLLLPGFGGLRNTPGGTLKIQSGLWQAFNLGQNNTGEQMRGSNFIENATVLVSGSGRYTSGSIFLGNQGTLRFMADRLTYVAEQYIAGYPYEINLSEGSWLDIWAHPFANAMGGGVDAFVTINQTGGRVDVGLVNGGGANNSLNLNSATNGAMNASRTIYNLSGGTLTVAGTIANSGATTNTFFNWTGGTLSCRTFTTAKMVSSGVTNALVNNGGTLAPGSIGTAGTSTITGSYSAAPTATLAMDIGGTTQANAFQVASGAYDYLLVNNGSTFLAGKLMVSLINGYSPASHTTAFTIINNTGTGAGVTGTFANLNGKILPLTDGYRLFTNVTQSATQVILSGYVINEYLSGTWDSTSTWSQGVIPGNQDYAAYFGALASSYSPNVGTRTLKGLVFASANSFTLGGTALTLQGDAFITVTAGSHTINAPIALSNATAFAVDGASVLTLAGNVAGAQDVTKTGTGTLALGGVNTLGSLTINAGIVKQAGGTTTLSALTLAGGTYDLWTGTLRIAEGVAGGAIDTLAEVEAAITAGTLKGRDQTVPIASFRISVVGGFVIVELKTRGTVISFL